jgi:hypothetical protein
MFIEQGYERLIFGKSMDHFNLSLTSVKYHYEGLRNGNSWSLISYGNDAMMRFLNQI